MSKIYLDLGVPSEGVLLRRLFRRAKERIENQIPAYLLIRQKISGRYNVIAAPVEKFFDGRYRACFAEIYRRGELEMEAFLTFTDDGVTVDIEDKEGITVLAPTVYVGAPALDVESLGVALCSEDGEPLSLADL
jgi:hypothetical protein